MRGDSSNNEHKNIKYRGIFNLCDLHSNQPGRGKRYGQFVRSYQVVLCNYNIFEAEHELVERFTMKNERGEELCDAIMCIIVDLTKAKDVAKKPVDSMTAIEMWAVFFALADKPAYDALITEIANAMEGIYVARETLQSISQNPDERARFRSRRIWQQDREHEMAVAINKVHAEYEPLLADKDAKLADKDAKLADKDAKLADKDAELTVLRAQLKAIMDGGKPS